jgi:hypothetical protein
LSCHQPSEPVPAAQVRGSSAASIRLLDLSHLSALPGDGYSKDSLTRTAIPPFLEREEKYFGHKPAVQFEKVTFRKIHGSSFRSVEQSTRASKATEGYVTASRAPALQCFLARSNIASSRVQILRYWSNLRLHNCSPCAQKKHVECSPAQKPISRDFSHSSAHLCSRTLVQIFEFEFDEVLTLPRMLFYATVCSFPISRQQIEDFE